MDIIRAKEIIRVLADGIDPTTGEVIPAESVCNSPEVIRALHTILAYINKDRDKDPLRNAGKPWTAAEDDKLREEFLDKMKISDIKKEHGRSYGSIVGRLNHLGLK